jgi:hypothetical protein
MALPSMTRGIARIRKTHSPLRRIAFHQAKRASIQKFPEKEKNAARLCREEII